MRLNLYAQIRHTIIVDGIPLSDFMDGDFMEVDVDGNAAERTLGADGPAMNLTTAQGGKISITLKPTSPSLGLLYEVRNAQNLTPRMFSIVMMTGTEEVIVADGCAFAKLPSFSSGGNTMQGRKFDFECLKIKMDTSGVEAISGGFIGGLI